MSKYVYSNTTFRNGELSPKALGNFGSEEYDQSVAYLENFIPDIAGGLYKRPGTIYNGAFGFNPLPYMIPFVSGDGEKFIICIRADGSDTGQYSPVAFFKISSGTFLTASDLNHVTGPRNYYKNIDPNVDIYGFQYCQEDNLIIVTHASHTVEPIVIKYTGDDPTVGYEFVWTWWGNITGDEYTFKVKSSWRGVEFPYGDKNTSSVTLTPDAAAAARLTASTAIFNAKMIGSYVRISDSSDEGIFYIDDMPTIKKVVTVSGDTFTGPATVWASGEKIIFHSTSKLPEPLQVGRTYYAIRLTTTTFQVAYTEDDVINGVNITLTSAGAGTISSYPLGILDTLADGSALINFSAPTVASGSDNWSFSLFSDYYGWPSSCSFFEGRLYFGGTKLQPTSLFGSLVGNKFFFMQERLDQDITSQDDVDAGNTPSSPSGIAYTGVPTEIDPFRYSLATSNFSVIKWLVAGKRLFVGTNTSEGYVTGGDSGIISRTNIQTRFYTSTGSAGIQAYKANQSLVYLSRDERHLRDFIFIDTNGSYVSVNLNEINDEIVHHNYVNSASVERKNNKFLHFVYDQSRSIYWAITSNFQLVGLTYDRNTKRMAWHRHTIGGNNVKVKGLCMFPSSERDKDDLFLAIERDVNSVTKYYLERMYVQFDEDDTNTGFMTYLDCSGDFTAEDSGGTVNYDSIGLDAAGRFPHLALASDLGVVISGRIHPDTDVTVIAGAGGSYSAVALNDDYSDGDSAVVGYKYDAMVKLNPIQAGGDFGYSNGSLHRTDRVTIRFYKSMSLKYSKHDGTYVDFFTEDYTVSTSGDLSLFTGEKQDYVEDFQEIYNQFTFKSDQPLPCNILSITQRGVAYAG